MISFTCSFPHIKFLLKKQFFFLLENFAPSLLAILVTSCWLNFRSKFRFLWIFPPIFAEICRLHSFSVSNMDDLFQYSFFRHHWITDLSIAASDIKERGKHFISHNILLLCEKACCLLWLSCWLQHHRIGGAESTLKSTINWSQNDSWCHGIPDVQERISLPFLACNVDLSRIIPS